MVGHSNAHSEVLLGLQTTSKQTNEKKNVNVDVSMWRCSRKSALKEKMKEHSERVSPSRIMLCERKPKGVRAFLQEYPHLAISIVPYQITGSLCHQSFWFASWAWARPCHPGHGATMLSWPSWFAVLSIIRGWLVRKILIRLKITVVLAFLT